MNFNVYLDDATARKLSRLAKRRRLTRNAIIRQAVADWVSREGRKKWPERILRFHGVAGFAPFESHRRDLGPEPGDPFAR